MKINLDVQALGDDGFHIFCRVKVNGKTCKALIDTGASKSVISKKLVEKLKITEFTPHNENQMTGIHPEEMKVSFATIESINFDKIEYTNIIAGVIDLEHVNAQYKTLGIRPFQIIIGGDILVLGKALIDYYNKKLKLSKL